MSDLDTFFGVQQSQEDFINLKALCVQLSINLCCCLVVFSLFCWLRPRYPLVYSPKSNLSKYDIRRPRSLDPGWFDWILPILRMNDKTLIDHIGFDAYVFMYFIRLLRQLIIIMASIAMFIFLPLDIVAAYNTGDWPPSPSLGFLSISDMNYHSGKESPSANHAWFWSPAIATWLFTTIISLRFYSASEHFLRFRLTYYLDRATTYKQLTSPTESMQFRKQELVARTLLVHLQFTQPLQDANQHKSRLRDSTELKECIDTSTQLPCKHAYIGKYNSRLYLLISDYKTVISKLEKALHTYLQHGDKRPTIRLGWRCHKVDAIDHYTAEALELEKIIQKNRSRVQDSQHTWVVYSSEHEASQACRILTNSLGQQTGAIQVVQARQAPSPQNIVWSSMNLDETTFQLKQWYGSTLFLSAVFVGSLPFAVIAVTSNMVNVVRLFPQSENAVQSNELLLGIVQSYVTPCLTVVLQMRVPQLLSFITQQQAYMTKTAVERQTLVKLYLFFLANNLFVFTLVHIMVGILGQITALHLLGELPSKDLSPYIVQIAKNMTDMSSFWIDYVCFRAVGVAVNLLRPVRVLRHSSLSPTPPRFPFARNYGLVMTFFTAVLVYSVTAPIVLPFALVYFVLVNIVCKYKLVYVYVTETETHGRVWALLGRLVTVSLVVFQAMVILVLSLKAGSHQVYALVPLPIITTVVGFIYTRYLDRHTVPQHTTNEHATDNDDNDDTTHWINTMYLDDTLQAPLWKPRISEDQRQWLELCVYKHNPQWPRIRDTLYTTTPTTLVLPTSPSLEELNIVQLVSDEKTHIETIPVRPPVSREPTLPSAPPTYYDAITSSRRHSL